MISSDSKLFRMMTPALALCLCAGVATAQNEPRERDRDQDQQERQDQQRERPREPMEDHPLWRFPVDQDEDWQDEDKWTDREREGQMGQETGDQTGMQSNYRTAYWEGYYDGYEDDEFGYDHWNDQWDLSYSSAYTDGYYDGYYDQQLEYGYDPNYYIYSVAVVPTGESEQKQTERQRGEQRRQGDETRARGDRRATGTPGGAQVATRDIKSVAALSLVRGSVSKISEAERPDKPEHTVLRIDFQNRDPLTADFGPHMSRQRLPFDSGDRISLIGYHKESDQGETMIVSQIAHDGKIYKLRSAGKQREGQTDRQRDMRQRDSERPGGGG